MSDFCNRMGCSPRGSSVHGISQAIILDWVATYFSRGSSRPRDQIWVLLYWQVDSLPLNHQGSPHFLYFIYFLCEFTFYISYNLWKLHSTFVKKKKSQWNKKVQSLGIIMKIVVISLSHWSGLKLCYMDRVYGFSVEIS